MARDSDPFKWKYAPHTKAKHDILAYYLDGWYPILARWHGRLLFLDGFAGRGRYESGEEGSPLIALRRLLEHRSFNSLMKGREFVFYLIEADEDNAASLEREIQNYKASIHSWPSKVKTVVVNDKFDSRAGAIIKQLREQKKRLAPTFALIDPFGYKGIPMELLADLFSYPRTELLINFMVGNIHRFITRDGQERVMRELFGKDVREVLDGYDGQASRVEYLRSVYVRQLKERVGFEHVQSFTMVNSTGNIVYYLLHGTRHINGVKKMKEAMWRVDPASGHRFSDRLAGQDVLFVPDPDLRPLQSKLLTAYSGCRDIKVSDIETYTIAHTPYRETHVRPVLRTLEQDRKIRVNRPPGKRQFAEGVTIDFPQTP